MPGFHSKLNKAEQAKIQARREFHVQEARALAKRHAATTLARSTAFEVGITGVFQGHDSPDDEEVLVVLDFFIPESAVRLKKRVYRLDIVVSLTGERESGEEIEGESGGISDVTLFRPAESMKVVGVYEPLPSTDTTEDNLKVVHKLTGPSTVDIIVDIIPVSVLGNLHFVAAVLVKSDSRASSLGLGLKADSKFRVHDDVKRTSRHETNEFDTILFFKHHIHQPPVSWAAGNGWLDYLVQRKETHLDKEDNLGRTPLSWAAGNGQEQTVKFLLDEMGTYINQEDNEGRTPLSWAAGNGCEKTVEMLLKKKDEIDPEYPDNKARTPLSWAAHNGHSSIVFLLLTFGFSSKANFDTVDDQGETPLSRAAQNKHNEVMHLLVEEGLKFYPEINIKIPGTLSWASTYLHKAVEKGWLGLVELLIQKNVKVDSMPKVATQNSRSPLCVAAEQGNAQMAEALLKAGANRDFQTEKDGDTPLIFAVREGREDVVKLLLEAGADISVENAMAKTPQKLAEDGDHHTVLQMLAQREADGPLAETDEGLNREVDHEFKATVFDFKYTTNIYRHDVKEVSVDELLKNPRLKCDQSNNDSSFKWLHLPANNMRWVEVLMSRIYDNPTQTYRVLSSERWVGRQHRGASNVHHARFMQPLCQTFHGISKTLSDTCTPQTSGNGSKECLVLFMPYLHWDTVDHTLMRELVIKGNPAGPEVRHSNETNVQSLLRTYLRDSHPLHVRRTLDQYYYHSMKDTRRRDMDQVVSRYQKDHNLEPKVMTMVDQVWLWVLAGDVGRVDAVITCFPYREQAAGDLDRYDFTDVLRNIKLHLLDETSSVRTPYDLAGIIASKCSRAYLGIGSMNETPGFSEMYETAISDVMRKEAELFETFNILTKAPDEEHQLTSEIVNVLTADPAKGAQPLVRLIDLCKRYRDSSFHAPLTASDINLLDSLPALNQNTLAMQLLKKIGRVQVLDISKEISLLREIKDIQDELSIMSMLFDDQKKVLKTLESVIRSKASIQSNLQALQQRKEDLERPEEDHAKATKNMSTVDIRPVNIMSQDSMSQAHENLSAQTKMSYLPMEEEYKASSSTKLRSLLDPQTHLGLQNAVSTQKINRLVKGKGPNDVSGNDYFLELSARAERNNEIIDSGGIITKNYVGHRVLETLGDSRKHNLPLAVVQASIDEIGRMLQQARKANQALDFLVDLKQKQSNVLDSRSARIQAEESLKMTEQTVKMTEETVKMNKENERQGKTLMAFTIVTIIFLPLSFMASFFAVNIADFQRDEKGFLSLRYVSEIMFPISATITAVLIYFAFKVERLESVWTWIKAITSKAWIKIFGHGTNSSGGLPN